MASSVDLASTAAAASPGQGFWRALLRSPSGLAGVAIVAILVASAAFAALIAPYDPLQMGAGPRLQAPSAQYLFGTDDFGRDLFSRVLYGARLTLQIGLIAIRRGDELLGYATAEPYGVVEAGRIVSLSGAASTDLGVRLPRPARSGTSPTTWIVE